MKNRQTKEIPILFSTPMVRAIVKKSEPKTKTRRTRNLEAFNQHFEQWNFIKLNIEPDGKLHAWFESRVTGDIASAIFPYGKPGDSLWVRETFGKHHSAGYFYKADSHPAAQNAKIWKPCIHMPKEAARIWLELLSVGVERLQDITEQDAIAEGCIQYEAETDWLTAKYGFQVIWTEINGEESWNANPWVWVIEFKRIERL